MLNARKLPLQVNIARDIDVPIQYLAEPVGSGKTEAVIREISQRKTDSNIFVAPTILLVKDIAKRLNEAGVENVIVVISEGNRAPVYERVLKLIRERQLNEAHSLIITTETFRNILISMSNADKDSYHVYLDEGIEAVHYQQFSTGRIDEFASLLSEDNGKITANKEYAERLRRVAYKPDQLKNDDDLRAENFIPIARWVVNDLYDVHGTVTEKSICAVAMLKPDEFTAFKSITIIAAIFEQSLLAVFWERKYGIKLVPYETEHNMFDTHREKGPLISIYYTLHEDDWASVRNLKRNWATGEDNAAANSNNRVIDEICRNVDTHFNGEQYCWATGTLYKNKFNTLSGKRMPAVSAGLNDWADMHNVVSFVCVNPPEWVKNIVVNQLAMEDEELYSLWKLSHTYQTIGRCSLRDRNSKHPITIVVLSEDCAKKISTLFPGSKIVGRIGDLPSYRRMKKKIKFTPQDNRAYHKEKIRCLERGAELPPKDQWYLTKRVLQLAKG